MPSFSVQVSYAQIAVFDSNLLDPFNNWTGAHVRQGFSWRPGSVSFATIEDGGVISVHLTRASAVDLSASTAERIIVVPFSVPACGGIEVASIAESVPLQLPPGEYELTFEHGHSADLGMWANFYFRPVDAPGPAQVLRADPALSPPEVLVMTAQPA